MTTALHSVSDATGGGRFRTDTILATKVLVALVALAQLGDVLSTNRVLAAHVEAYEANPVTRLLMEQLGAMWWLPKAALAGFILCGLAALRQSSPQLLVIAAAMVVFHVLVLVNNLLNL